MAIDAQKNTDPWMNDIQGVDWTSSDKWGKGYLPQQIGKYVQQAGYTGPLEQTLQPSNSGSSENSWNERFVAPETAIAPELNSWLQQNGYTLRGGRQGDTDIYQLLGKDNGVLAYDVNVDKDPISQKLMNAAILGSFGYGLGGAMGLWGQPSGIGTLAAGDAGVSSLGALAEPIAASGYEAVLGALPELGAVPSLSELGAAGIGTLGSGASSLVETVSSLPPITPSGYESVLNSLPALDPTLPSLNTSLWDTIKAGGSKLADWAAQNPQLAIQAGSVLAGALGGKDSSQPAAGIGTVSSGQQGLTQTKPAAFKREVVAPTAGYRPGFSPEHVYFKQGS